MENHVRAVVGEKIAAIAKVVEINQKDYSQGHICPNTRKWLGFGPSGICTQVGECLRTAPDEQRAFYESVIFTLEGASTFMLRCAELANHMADTWEPLREISRICRKLAC